MSRYPLLLVTSALLILGTATDLAAPIDLSSPFQRTDEGWAASGLGGEIRTTVHATGFRVAVREGAPDGFQLEFALASVRRGDLQLPRREARLSAHESRAELDHGAIREWLVQRSEGIEHGFDLATRLPGEAALQIVLDVQGAERISVESERSIMLRARPGLDGVLHYAGLKVFDATNAEIPARFVASAQGIVIEIDDQAAPYPLRIDPILSPSQWEGSGSQISGAFGLAVATVGDLNGDGYSEVAIGMPLYDGSNGVDQGRVRIVRGSATGLAGTLLTLYGSAGSRFGSAISTAGDFDGDGFLDVLIGAPRAPTTAGGEGQVYLYRGDGESLDTSQPWWVIDSFNAGSQLGSSVDGGGDLNGDGLSDIIVGEPMYGGGLGRARVYLGSASPPSDFGTELFGGAYTGDTPRWGSSVALVGDVNRDGFDDVAVGAPYSDWRPSVFPEPHVNDAGYAKIWFGSAAGVEVTADVVLSPQDGALDPAANLYFGFSLAGAGDLDHDGYADLVVGVPYRDQFPVPNPGSVRVFLGSNLTAGNEHVFDEIFGQSADDHFGRHVATAGDLDGDGYADFVVGAPDALTGPTRNGRAYAYCGKPHGQDASGAFRIVPRLCGTMTGEDDGDRFGVAVATSGDTDGDGFSDLIVGAHLAELGNATDEGRAYNYLGSPDGLHASDLWIGNSGGRVGESIAYGGDVDGDGLGDVLLGAPKLGVKGTVRVEYGVPRPPQLLEDGTADASFGAALAGNCDFDGDGYSDVAIGGPFHDALFMADAGGVWVWYGSENGIAGELTNAPWKIVGGPGNNLGRAVACGDLNGDGLSDLIVGSIGRAQVFLGHPSGLSTASTWSVSSAGLSYGGEVAFVGDVNRDRFGDMLVSETGYSTGTPFLGRAMLYLGSATGPSTTPAQTFVGEQSAGQFATAIAGAGDVNHDGYADIAIGAFGHDNSSSVQDVGKLYVYHGGPAGPATTASFTATGSSGGSEFGRSVAPAGDVDADGYSDIVVGAPSRAGSSIVGFVRVYYGGSGGLTGSSSTLPGPNHNYGSAVAATDMNGDGFSDLVFSADLLGANDGRVLQAISNQADEYDGQPTGHYARQLNRLDSPVADQSKEPTPGHQRVTANGRRVGTKGRLKLVVETKPVGTPLEGTELRSSAWVTPAPGLGVTLLVDRLDLSVDLFRWRARILSSDPRFPGSAWLTLGARGGGELDFRSAQAVPPGKVIKLAFASGSKTQLTWQSVFEAERYDVVRGALPALVTSQGNFTTSTSACVANDVTTTSVIDTTKPASGAGLWYLVRAANFVAIGSYDETSAGLAAPRDAEIAASGVACP